MNVGRRGARRPRTTLALFVVGIAFTSGWALAASRLHQENEERLLQERVDQAAAVLRSSVGAVTVPLSAVAEVAGITAAAPRTFRRAAQALVGEGQPFVSVSAWEPGAARPSATVGRTPTLSGEPPSEVAALLTRSLRSPGLIVIGPLGDPAVLGYSFTAMTPGSEVVTYAESALPEDRTSVPRSDDAFADLDYALHLVGSGGADDELLFASTADLPDPVADATLELGDRQLRLSMSPRGDLGGPVMARLPWIVLGTGLAVTVVLAVLVERLLRRRSEAERSAEAERQVARRLQDALRPGALASVPGLEIAHRYEPAEDGTAVGGDWYDAIPTGPDRLVVVVGDIAGHGLAVAALMAEVRHAVRAYVIEGHPVDEVLARLNHLLLDGTPGDRFATVLCLDIGIDVHEVGIASGGHLPPLVHDGEGSRFLDISVGPPMGVVADAEFPVVRHVVGAGALVVAFTDGLVERRDESVDDGLARLAGALPSGEGPLGDVLGELVARVRPAPRDDDLAMVGARWTI